MTELELLQNIYKGELALFAVLATILLLLGFGFGNLDSSGKITPLPIPPQWISVKDRLPDDASEVLAYYDCGDNSQVLFVNYNEKRWYDAVCGALIDTLGQGLITHWMPVPEPPGMKEDV